MLAVPEADRLLAGFRDPFPTEVVSLEAAAGRVLREPIRADKAHPAGDRSRMDGIAIGYSAWESGVREFSVMGTLQAGQAGDASGYAAGATACVEVMTGALCPEGYDTVIPYEDIALGNGIAKVLEGKAIAPVQYVHRRGSDCIDDELLLSAGTTLNAVHIAVAASIGKSKLSVTRKPRITVVATGDELVDVEDQPLPHQIRISNPYGLKAMLGKLADVRITRTGDNPVHLTMLLERSLAQADMVLVTGGVSAGKFDFVPEILEDLGVKRVFHKLAQRPGKPLWFGEASGGQLVFGLPGNPVSAMVCARRFVAPLLQAKSGATSGFEAPRARLETDVQSPKGWTQYLPVRVYRMDAGGLAALSRPVNGSGDFAGLGSSDGFLELAADRTVFTAGETLPFFPWEA